MPGHTEGNHTNPQSVQPASYQKFEDLPNMKEECYPHKNDIQFIIIIIIIIIIIFIVFHKSNHWFISCGCGNGHISKHSTIKIRYNIVILKCQVMQNQHSSLLLSGYIKHHVMSGPLSPRHGAPSSCRWRNGLRYGGQLLIYRISSRGQPTRGGPPAWGLGKVLTTPPC